MSAKLDLHFILAISGNEDFKKSIQSRVEVFGYRVLQVPGADDIFNLPDNRVPGAAILEASTDLDVTLENLHSMAEKFPNTKVIVLYDSKCPIDTDDFMANGAYKLLHKTFEGEMLLSILLEISPIEIPSDKVTLDVLQPVRISDLKSDVKLGFDLFIHLPANNKLFLYRAKNTDISNLQFEKFKKEDFSHFYIRKSDLPEFRKFVATLLNKTVDDSWLSQTERVAKLRREVRNLMGPLFDSTSFDHNKSREVLENCRNVVAEYVMSSSANPELYKQILTLANQGHSNYNHSINVSTYATLFAMALGYKDIEAATIGGLLHDIGISQLPPEIASRMEYTLSPEDKEVYKRHVQLGLDLLQNKKIPAGDLVVTIIQQHHEHMDGTGFPQGLSRDQIHPLARIVALADAFDDLTTVRDGKHTYSPLAAINCMASQNCLECHPQRFDHDMVTSLVAALGVQAGSSLNFGPLNEILKSPVQMGAAPENTQEKNTDKPEESSEEADSQVSNEAEAGADFGLTPEEMALITKKAS